MATKKTNGVLKNNIEIRNEQIINNNGKYRLYGKDLNTPIGLTYDVYSNEDNKPEYLKWKDIVSYTYNNETEFSKQVVSDKVRRNIDDLYLYSVNNVKPSFRVNDYDGAKDYISYISEVYGREESYAGHLAGLIGIRGLAEDLVYDIFPDMEGKTFADYINEIRQYTDVKYAMEADSVGIVKNLRVSDALKGIITTNINNYSGKDSRLGMIANTMYASTLLRAAHFNSMRRTKYITQDNERLYGNNLSNVYNLSSLFTINPETGRIPEVDSNEYITYSQEPIEKYLATQIDGYRSPLKDVSFKNDYSYNETYFNVKQVKDNKESYSRWEGEGRRITNGVGYTYYDESESNSVDVLYSGSDSSTSDEINVDRINSDVLGINGGYNILSKTNELFANRTIKTMINRYYESGDKTPTLTQSAVNKNFGISHGRNLLSKASWENPKTVKQSGQYGNPYCRVWTNHHQYAKMKDLIRPFTSNEDEFIGVDGVQSKWNAFRNSGGPDRLAKYGVINKNGMVNITPSVKSEVDVKQCMFSIENLAWKDINFGEKAKYRMGAQGEIIEDKQMVLSKEQQGPNGGRIMWFPPYDIEFSENVSVKWDSAEFIGRGEPVYTYSNTKRSGNLSFTMLVDNPAILNYWLLDKKNGLGDKEGYEQEILRFFAGCEDGFAPSDDVTNGILNEIYEGGSINIEGAEPESEMIFYTFFPNNYSGKDDVDNFAQILFGGSMGLQGEILSNCNLYGSGTGDIKDSCYQGYEMGLSPISTNYYLVKDLNGEIDWTLDEVCGYGEAQSLFGYLDLENDFKLSGLTITWSNFKNRDYDCIGSYAENTMSYEINKESDAIYDLTIENAKKEIEKLAGKVYNLPNDSIFVNGIEDEKDLGSYGSETIIGVFVEELKQTLNAKNSFERDDRKTSAYIGTCEKLSEQLEKFKGYIQDVKKYENQISLNETLKNDENHKEEVEELFGYIDAARKLLTGNTQYIKTNALYFYNNGSTLVSGDSAEKVYIEYYINYSNKVRRYSSKEEADKKFFKEQNDIGVCLVESGSTKAYYTITTITDNTINESDWTEFKTKKEFGKSECVIGKCKKQYLVKSKNGEIFDFDSSSNAKECIKLNTLFTQYSTKTDFEQSKSVWGLLNDGKTFCGKKLLEIASNEVVKKVKETLKGKNIIEEYFVDNSFTTFEAAKKADYGMVQYFYTLSNEDSSANKDFQEFVIKSDVSNGKDDDIMEETKVREGTLDFESIENYTIPSVRGELSINNEKYQYPFDADKINGNFKNPQSYTDLQSFGLNSTYEVVKQHLGDNNITCSFAEFYAGCNDAKPEYTDFVLNCERAVLTKYMNLTGDTLEEKIKEAESRIAYVASVFGTKTDTNKDLIKISKADVRGDASSEGNKDKNIKLSNDRANSMADSLRKLALLKDKVGVKLNDGNATDGQTNNLPADNNLDISDIESKRSRNTRVHIKFKVEKIEEEKKDTLLKRFGNSELSIDKMRNSMQDEQGNNYSNRFSRYDNERLFFEMLSENDNIAYKKLVDKVKYFSPAFHSITPEGFNARLTFLHQCTRQGPTVTSSDIGKANTAANLAFGRAPFCILRLGDFLNTKIVINSVSITYPDNQWDINPEGIGMQFMMAKVNLGIDILGGSDISAPIKRLQNAVSFNYYANTSIYDNRSDMAVYENGEVTNISQWSPTLI